MSRRVQWSLLAAIAVAALIALAGCGHYMYGERESWRRDAEIACIGSGAAREGPERVRISAIDGPGICGAEYPLRVSALGDTAPLGYDDEPLRPPGVIPESALPKQWVQSNALPPPPVSRPQYGQPQTYPPQAYPAQTVPVQPPPPDAPMSLYAPGIPQPQEDDYAFQPAPPPAYDAPRGNAPRGNAAPPAAGAQQTYSQQYPQQPYPQQSYPQQPYPPNDQPAYPPPGSGEQVPLGPPRAPAITRAGPVEIKPAATLACPIVSALDQWIAASVQPAALRWFRLPVVEIKQISAYSCRGMNGNPNAHISEHAFGNALDIAEFTLADGHKVSVQYGWRGSPEEQGFLHDVQLAACQQFSTVLAPGANVYHYNHIHVDLMRRSSGRRICQPAAIPGEVVAERARARYAAEHPGEPAITGSIRNRPSSRALGYSGDDFDRLPPAVPGED